MMSYCDDKCPLSVRRCLYGTFKHLHSAHNVLLWGLESCAKQLECFSEIYNQRLDVPYHGNWIYSIIITSSADIDHELEII